MALPMPQPNQNADKVDSENEPESDPNDAEFVCDCGCKFSRLGWLMNHMKRCIKEFVCDLCAKRFKSIRTLRKHKQEIHQKPFKCTNCNESFNTPKKLLVHVRSIHEATVKCQHCESVLKNKRSFKHHQKKFHGPEIRKQSEKDIENIEEHDEAVVNEASPEKATENDEVKPRKEKVANKNRKRKKDKLHSCLQCPKAFNSSNGLRKHYLLHDKLMKMNRETNKSINNLDTSSNNHEEVQIVLIENGEEINFGSAVFVNGPVDNELVVGGDFGLVVVDTSTTIPVENIEAIVTEQAETVIIEQRDVESEALEDS